MKLTFEIPDSVSEKKTFSKGKVEREVLKKIGNDTIEQVTRYIW
jgi:hypothetical protein